MQTILNSIYQFLPKNIDAFSPEYVETEEIARLKSLLEAEMMPGNKWEQMLTCAGPKAVDHTHTRYLDRCYRLSVNLGAKSPDQYALVLQVSLIAPFYCYYTSRWTYNGGYYDHEADYELTNFTRAELIEELDDCISQIFPDKKRLPHHLGITKIPDISLEITRMGEVTVYHALFSEHYI